jgi:hypothetical protein
MASFERRKHAHIERQYFLFSPITGWVMDIALSAENYHDLGRYSVAVSEGIVIIAID